MVMVIGFAPEQIYTKSAGID
jgi:hypothetical protein